MNANISMKSLINIFAVNVEDISISLFYKLIPFASLEVQKKINNFLIYEDKLRSLVGNILLKYLICKNYRYKNNELLFSKTIYGKPYLLNNRYIFFNISHSGKWVICSIHQFPLGIDIELIKPIDFSIAKRYFSLDEYSDLERINKVSDKISYFYSLWTMKESYLKLLGTGLTTPLNSFTIKCNKNKFYLKKMENKFYFKQYSIDEKYKISICSCVDYFSQQVCIMHIDDLLNE